MWKLEEILNPVVPEVVGHSETNIRMLPKRKDYVSKKLEVLLLVDKMPIFIRALRNEWKGLPLGSRITSLVRPGKSWG